MSTENNGRRIATVVAIWRFPVKSMAGQSLPEVDVDFNGLAGDRRYAFVQEGMERDGFPWLTIREHAEMWRYQPSFAEPDRPNASRTVIRTPSGEELDVVDPKLAAELGFGARVIKQNRGAFDALPLSLMSTQTAAEIGSMAGADVTPLRFRPNLVVEALDGAASFPEDEWVGRVLRVGGMRMRVDKRDSRCGMINVDPETQEKNKEVLKAVARQRGNFLGVYGSTVEPGTVAVGDPVFLED